jgi:hypothetical protein
MVMDVERKEIRPQMRLGLILIGIGAANALTGLSSLLAGHLDGAYAGWIDKALVAALIGYGIWLARKKIIIDKGAMLFEGLAKGRRLAEVPLQDIENVGYDAVKRVVEIKAKGGTLLVALKEGSHAKREMFEALKERGVKVSERP